MSPTVESLSWEGEQNNILVLRLKDGRRHAVPKSSIETVSSAKKQDAENVEILGDGSYLHWPALDFDLYVPSLVDGVSGSASWMSILGRQGGLVRSEKKADAARQNGLRGGRPCRPANKDADLKSLRASIVEKPPVINYSEYSFSADEFLKAFVDPPPSRLASIPRFM
jgi:hypothetical protein